MTAPIEQDHTWFQHWGNGAISTDGPLVDASSVEYEETNGLHQVVAQIPLIRYETNPDGQLKPVTEKKELIISYDSAHGVLAAEIQIFPDLPSELTGSMPLHAETLKTITENRDSDWGRFFNMPVPHRGYNPRSKTFELADFFRSEYEFWALTTQAVDAHILPGFDAAGVVKPLILPNSEYGIRFGWIARMEDLERVFAAHSPNDPLFPEEIQQNDEDRRWSWFVTHVLSRATRALQNQYPLVHDYSRWFADERRADLTLRLMMLGEPNAESGLLGQGSNIEKTDWYRSIFGDRGVDSLEITPNGLPVELSGDTPDWYLRWVMGASGIVDAAYRFVGFDPNDPTQNPLEYPQSVVGWVPCTHYSTQESTKVEKSIGKPVVQQEEIRFVWHPDKQTLTLDIVLFPGGANNVGVVQRLSKHMGQFQKQFKEYMLTGPDNDDLSLNLEIFPRIVQRADGVMDLTLGVAISLRDGNRADIATQALAALKSVFPDAEYFAAYFLEHNLPQLEATS